MDMRTMGIQWVHAGSASSERDILTVCRQCEEGNAAVHSDGIQKNLVSVKFVSAILGPEMAAPILWTPGKMCSFCRKNPVHKIPRFRGGGYFWFGGGGGSADFFFYGRGFF